MKKEILNWILFGVILLLLIVLVAWLVTRL